MWLAHPVTCPTLHSTLQVSVQSELSRSLEPLRQLSSSMVPALPAPAAAAQQLPAPGEQLWGEELDGRLARLQAAVGQQVQAATQQILDMQVGGGG